MVYVSFFPASAPGCVVSSGSSTWWSNNCPQDLVTAIKEAHSKSEGIISVSVANDGDWFLSTNSVNRKKPGNDPMTSRVLRFCHVATAKTGHETNLGNIVWITFTPDGQGFIGVVGHNGVAYCVFENLPKSLDDHLRTHNKLSQVKMVSIGFNDSWAIVYQDGDMSVDGICTSLLEKLKNIRAVGYNVESIILSPSTISNFMVTYENGASHYDVPHAWASSIDKQILVCQENHAVELQQLQQANAMNNAAMLRLARANLEAAAMVANAQASASYYQSFGNF